MKEIIGVCIVCILGAFVMWRAYTFWCMSPDERLTVLIAVFVIGLFISAITSSNKNNDDTY